jgi:predicted signal transduction protein with EAL and GGDEF domain
MNKTILYIGAGALIGLYFLTGRYSFIAVAVGLIFISYSIIE